jgi:hypothetical protein
MSSFNFNGGNAFKRSKILSYETGDEKAWKLKEERYRGKMGFAKKCEKAKSY